MVIEPIIWRRSVRQYSEEPVLDESVNDIIKAAHFAPSAMGKHAIEFVVIKDEAAKEGLSRIIGQDPVASAPVLLLLVVNADISPMPEHDLAVGSSFAMVQAAAMGLGTAWIHIEKDQKKEIRKILDIPENYDFINIIPIGYPKDELLDHSDNDFDRGKIHSEKF